MRTLNLRGFAELKTLGKGTYGSVYKARRESDGVAYAVKVVSLAAASHKDIEDTLNEIRLMASFNSPFIVRFCEALCDCKRLCIVTEYCRLGDLAHLIDRKKKKNKHFREDVIWRFLLQLLEGLRVLHSCGVVHRDLKSANVLLSAPDLLKIGDLGISTVLTKRELARTQIGTPLYIAPEVWKRRPYNQKCDMWSLGVLLYEMMTFTYPFTGRGPGDISMRVCLGRYTLPTVPYTNELVSIVRRLLQVNPGLRPTAKELLDLQCVKVRMPLLDPFLSEIGNNNEQLLSEIKVPANIRHVNLPNPAYAKKTDIKPIEERIHLTNGFKTKLALVNSPDLQMITDLDLWSPNGDDESPEPLYPHPPSQHLPRLSVPISAHACNPRFRPKIR
jgi:NIMA (never in mitosis gene a)-related kinase